jgi:hypothetical protein
MRGFSLHLLSETFMILKINEPDIKNMRLSLHVYYSLFLSEFNNTWILYDRLIGKEFYSQ